MQHFPGYLGLLGATILSATVFLGRFIADVEDYR